MTIDWQEWRDHFLLHSLENVEDVLYFWKHSTVSWGPPTRWRLAPASLGLRRAGPGLWELCSFIPTSWVQEPGNPNGQLRYLLRLQGQLVGTGVMGEKNTPNGVPTLDPHNCQLPAGCSSPAPRLTLRLRGRCRQTLSLEGPEESTGGGEGGPQGRGH